MIDESTARGRLVMVGPFPPPLGGAAKITEAVRQAVAEAGVGVHVVDTSAGVLTHSRSVGYHLTRLARNLRAAAAILAAARRSRALYLVPDGGFGVWYSLVHASVAVVRYREVFVHHHTCRYIDGEALAVRLITRLLRRCGTHVFLTPGMARRYAERYGPVRHLVLGNAWFTEPGPIGTGGTVDGDTGPGADRNPRDGEARRTVRLGHLSNLCGEKGFFRVADAFDRVREEGVDAELHLAGPCVDQTVQPRLATLQRTHGGRVTYHGPLHGGPKAAFYRSLDLFLFPTNFAQEAAPNVIFEAAEAGVPSLSVDRACILELLGQLTGESCDRDAEFGAFVLRYLGRAAEPLSDDKRRQVRERFDRMRDQASREAGNLIHTLARAASGDTWGDRRHPLPPVRERSSSSADDRHHQP